MASTSKGTRHILAAIDGTGSAEWRRPQGDNSHVHGFFRDFQVPARQKAYFDGPDLLGNAVTPISNRVLNWILQATDRQGPAVPQLRMRAVGLFTRQIELRTAPIEARIDQPRTTGARPRVKGSNEQPFQVSLIGHSRGGLIAIAVARSLAASGIRVHFLGLYDAVDMARGLDGDKVRNVDHVVHARRHPSMRSRSTWGNTGTSSATEDGYAERFFMTSHGGIGGDPTLEPQGLGDDFSCNTRGLAAGIAKAMGGDIGRMCTDNGRQADSYIRAAARRLGLPLR